MNMQTSVMAPPPPKGIAGMKLATAMMRDILIKTMYRSNLTQATDLARVICLPLTVTQELIDIARGQLLCEATGR